MGRPDGTFETALTYLFPQDVFHSVVADDLDGDGDLDLALVSPQGVNILRNTTNQELAPQPGDANLDGRFDQLDIVMVLQAGKYKTGQPATAAEGDWNGDGWFDQLDIVMALRNRQLSARCECSQGCQLRERGLTMSQSPIRRWIARRKKPSRCRPLHRHRMLRHEPLESRQLLAAGVVINEIMYHPASDSSQEEFIELLNAQAAPVNLSGWAFVNGVDFTFPAMTLGPGRSLVVAADLGSFSAKYPRVTNVIGGWEGRLSNRGETIELADAQGNPIDRVRYADQGQWAVRTRGDEYEGHRGWVWRAEHDGDGRSLELINPALPNEHGQNWATSQVEEGTPGAANSVAASQTAPLVLDVAHQPTIPQSTDPVHVTARIVDESPSGVATTLHYRVNGQSDFSAVIMWDDGNHGDGPAGDGVHAATIPALPDGSVVEFYIQAIDRGGNPRTWPAVAEGNATGGNALYQVLDSFDANAPWSAEDQPITFLIMTEAETRGAGRHRRRSAGRKRRATRR